MLELCLKGVLTLAHVTRGHYLASLLLGAVFGIAAALFSPSQMFMLLPFVMLTNLRPGAFLIFIVAVLSPFAEELAKILPPFFLKTQENLEINVIEWMQLGVTSAFGFSLLENLSYFWLFINTFSLHSAIWLLLMRFLISTPMHLTATTIASYGVGNWDNYNEGEYLVFLAIAMLIHGLFNFGTITLGF